MALLKDANWHISGEGTTSFTTQLSVTGSGWAIGAINDSSAENLAFVIDGVRRSFSSAVGQSTPILARFESSFVYEGSNIQNVLYILD